MKFFIALLLTALISYIGGLYLPWWSIAIAAFLVAIIVPLKTGKAFLAGFLGVFLLWQGLAFFINSKNEGILASKVAHILPLAGNAILLMLVTAFVGGIIGGLAATSGSLFRAPKKG